MSLHDPVILVPQPDPFEAFQRHYNTDSLSPHDEVWTTEPQVLRFIRDKLLFRGELKSKRVWDDNEEEGTMKGNFSLFIPYWHPFSGLGEQTYPTYNPNGVKVISS